MNDNDDLKQELNNENIEAPKTNDVTTDTTPVVQEEVKTSNQNKKANINTAPRKKSNMKAGTKAQLITLGIVLFFWIFLASGVISLIKSIARGSKGEQ